MTDTPDATPPIRDADTERMIDECLDYFDFERVHRVMVALDWKWHVIRDHGAEPARVPDVPDLRHAARRHLRDAARYIDREERVMRQGSGGFEVLAGRGELALQFIIEYWSAERPEKQP